MCDLLDADEVREKVTRAVEAKAKIFAALYGDGEPLDAAAVTEQYLAMGARLADYVDDTTWLLNTALADGKRMLFEGAQGSLLDVDLGTYPFVTSSNSTACGIPAGAGVPPSAVDHTVGILKAYTTRVGTGPFPSELDNEVGNQIREQGNEYGTTTGRPRRCGWFDAVAARYSVAVNGVNEVAVMLLDVLSGLKEVGVCTGYAIDGQTTDRFIADARQLERVTPVIETFKGWSEDITQCERFEDLPDAARAYLGRMEELLGVPIGIVSVGPDRKQTLAR